MLVQRHVTPIPVKWLFMSATITGVYVCADRLIVFTKQVLLGVERAFI